MNVVRRNIAGVVYERVCTCRLCVNVCVNVVLIRSKCKIIRFFGRTFKIIMLSLRVRMFTPTQCND